LTALTDNRGLRKWHRIRIILIYCLTLYFLTQVLGFVVFEWFAEADDGGIFLLLIVDSMSVLISPTFRVARQLQETLPSLRSSDVWAGGLAIVIQAAIVGIVWGASRTAERLGGAHK
jgi:hypothetical protein